MKQEESFARELLHDYKLANKRVFIIIILLIITNTCSIIYNIYQANDMSSSVDTIDVKDINDITSSNFKIGE